MSIDVLDRVATVLEVEAWQLLLPAKRQTTSIASESRYDSVLAHTARNLGDDMFRSRQCRCLMVISTWTIRLNEAIAIGSRILISD